MVRGVSRPPSCYVLAQRMYGIISPHDTHRYYIVRLAFMRRFIFLFTFIFLGLLATDAYPGLRGGAGWRWPYALPDSAVPVLVLAGLLVIYLAGVIFIRRSQPPVVLALAWMVAGGAALGWGAAGIPHGDAAFTLFTRTVSPVQTGASTVAVREMATTGVSDTLDRWPDVMRDALDANIIHFTTSPPGQPLLHYAVAGLDVPGAEPLSMALRSYQCSNLNVMRYTEGELFSVGVFGLLMPLWAALAVIPIYFSARLLLNLHNKGGGSRSKTAVRTALQVAAWWPLVPTVLLFAPTWNTLYPFLCVSAFALLLGALHRARIGYAGAAGAGMSVTTFLNFAVVPVLLLFGLFTLGMTMVVRAESTTRGFVQAVRIGLWFGVGLLSVWIAFFVAAGHTPLDLAAVTAEKHSTLVAGRDYLAWLLLHPYDVLMFVGWPVAALFLWGVWRAIRRWRKPSPVGVLALALFVTVVLVDLAGVAQGENARIMSFYAPFFLLAAVPLFVDRRWDLPLLGAQALTVLVMASVLPVVPLDLNQPPQVPRTDVATLDSEALIPVEVVFDSTAYAGDFALDSHRFIADLGAQVITLETVWRGGAPVERPYRFEVVARAENAIDGEIVTEPHIWYAQNSNYLPTCWRAGDVIQDVTQIPLPAVSAPVVWRLDLRAVDERTGDVMQVTLRDDTVGAAVPLAPVNYP